LADSYRIEVKLPDSLAGQLAYPLRTPPRGGNLLDAVPVTT
jgi:hypothetical protein